MCRSAWRDRVDRFIFKYLQKRQTLMEHLASEWIDTVVGAARGALSSAPESAIPGGAAVDPAALTATALHAVRDKLEEKLLKKVLAECEEERVRKEVRKIRLEEEQEILNELDEAARPTARVFLKALNKALEDRITAEVDRSVEKLDDPEGVRGVIREALKALDEGRVGDCVSACVKNVETQFRSLAGAVAWPNLATPERERIVNEIIETLYRREIKDTCAAYLQAMTPEKLARSAEAALSAAPDIRPDQRPALIRHVLDTLRASFARSLDAYTPDEIARVIAESTPPNFLTSEHVERTNRLLDRLVTRTALREDKAGRKLPDDAISAARRNIMLAPLADVIKHIVRACLDGVIADLRAEKSSELTAALRGQYLGALRALAGPLFVQTAARKVAVAYGRQAFHEIYYQTAVVPVVDHVTRLFERPDVMKIYAQIETGLTERDRKAKAQRLIEKLNWTDAAALVEESVRPVLTAWEGALQGIAAGAVEEAVAASFSPADLEAVLDRAAELFENRLERVCTLDVEVPYAPETRENVIRAIEQVQDGIRRNEFSTARGALCGWCEYQSGCPAWCRYRDICKDTCKDEYHCKRWFDEKTGRLVEGRPPDMTHEEYLRRIEAKYEVTDRSLFRLSFSKMNSYELCPMNYRKLYLDHVSPKPKSFFSIGLSFHQTMEDLYAYHGPHQQPSLKMLLDLFRKKWISAGYRSREEEDFNFRRGLRMCEDYYEAYIDGAYKPAGAAEDYFEFKLGRTLLCGFIDRVDMNEDGSISIIDYKTNPKLYTQEELDEDQQMTIYYLAAREGKLESVKYKPVEVKQFIFQFVNFCKDLVATRDASYLGALQDRVRQFTEEMEWRQKVYKDSKFDPRAGMLLFPPQDNKYCQSCDHHHLCPLKTDMTLTGEVQKKGTQFEDGVDAKELAEESTDRVATYDVA
ncbi:MAG: hypothetical protein A3I06_05940 [Candidatus Lindowbacteria bacterium RIFCSPLOWO2_02_FULL_62_12]|nr:MAG: hypothetical protein A3I06_05940 [Candidatus Lindowbacteria bacterium RIFCSPLOWO2_02_FULL_62_12]